MELYRGKNRINVFSYTDSLKLFSLLCDDSFEGRVATKIAKHSNLVGYNNHLNTCIQRRLNEILRECPTMCEFIISDKKEMIQNIINSKKIHPASKQLLNDLPIEIIDLMNNNLIKQIDKQKQKNHKILESESLSRKEKIYTLLSLDKNADIKELDEKKLKQYNFLNSQSTNIIDDLLEERFKIFAKKVGLDLNLSNVPNKDDEKKNLNDINAKDIVIEMTRLSKMSNYVSDKEELELLKEIAVLSCLDVAKQIEGPTFIQFENTNYKIEDIPNSFEFFGIDGKLIELGADAEYLNFFKQYVKNYNIEYLKLLGSLEVITNLFTEYMCTELINRDEEFFQGDIYDPLLVSTTLEDKIFSQVNEKSLNLSHIKLLYDNFDLFTKKSDFMYTIFNESSYSETRNILNAILNTKRFYNDIFGDSKDEDELIAKLVSQAGYLCRKYFMNSKEIRDANPNHSHEYREYFPRAFGNMRRFIEMIKL